MTNEQAYVILENCASLLDSGTRFFTEDHVKQFHEAYELAMEALRKTERKRGRWIQTRHFGHMYRMCSSCSAERKDDLSTGWNYCPYCGTDLREGEADES